MAWIESHESLPSHPKTKRMCRLLKITPVVAVGHLHFLWWWAMNHAQDGSLDRYSADDIADACSWDGDSESFFNALVESGFVDRTSIGHSIHDWYDYAGKLIALRQKDAERKRNSRGKKDESEGHPVDIPRTSDGSLTESIRDLNPNLNQDLKDLKDTTTTTPQIAEIQKGLSQIAASLSFPPVTENPFKIFETEGFGTISSVIGDKIGDMIDTYGERWVCEAMKESAYYGKRNLPYVKSILERYKTSGVDEPWQQEKVRTFPRARTKLEQEMNYLKAERKEREVEPYFRPGS